MTRENYLAFKRKKRTVSFNIHPFGRGVVQLSKARRATSIRPDVFEGILAAVVHSRRFPSVSSPFWPALETSTPSEDTGKSLPSTVAKFYLHPNYPPRKD